MMGSKALDQDYLTLMQNHPYGKAIYKPLAVSSFHPGSIGYFDSVGDWNPIADISSAQAAWPAAFTPPPTEKLLSAPSENQTWGPKVGQQTTCRMIDLKESISLTALAGVPLEAGSCFRFETGTSAGSVLLTNGPVSHSRYYHEAPFKQWIAANSKSILNERPEVRDYGLWVVTSTWSVAEAAINCWSGRQKGVDVGFNFKVVEIGELAPKGGWYHAGESDGWIHVRANQVSPCHFSRHVSKKLIRQ
jgi:hypothetical protein